MSTFTVWAVKMLQDAHFVVGDEDFEGEVGWRAGSAGRTDEPDGRKATVAKLVQDLVTLNTGANDIADVYGVEAAGYVFLDVFDMLHTRFAISKRRRELFCGWFCGHGESWRGY